MLIEPSFFSNGAFKTKRNHSLNGTVASSKITVARRCTSDVIFVDLDLAIQGLQLRGETGTELQDRVGKRVHPSGLQPIRDLLKEFEGAAGLAPVVSPVADCGVENGMQCRFFRHSKCRQLSTQAAYDAKRTGHRRSSGQCSTSGLNQLISRRPDTSRRSSIPGRPSPAEGITFSRMQRARNIAQKASKSGSW